MEDTGYFASDDVYQTGVPGLDEDHHRFFAIYNVFVRTFKEYPNSTETHDLYRAVIAYVAIHFQTEEDMMAQFGYPEISPHREEHRRFCARWEQFEPSVAQGTAKVGQLLEVLREWLTRHIPDCDARFGRFALLENDKAIKAGGAPLL